MILAALTGNNTRVASRGIPKFVHLNATKMIGRGASASVASRVNYMFTSDASQAVERRFATSASTMVVR